MSQDSKSSRPSDAVTAHDERTIDAVKRYLHFFKIPGFLEKKWKKKVKDSLDEWFAAVDGLEESVGIKDEKLEALNIDDLLTVLDRIQQQFADGADDLTAINDAIEAMLTELLATMDLYCDSLQAVIDEQNGYEWYTPKCYAFLAGNTLYLGYGNPPQEGDYYGSATVTGVWTDFESTGSAPWQSVKSSIFEVRTLSSFTQATVTAVSMWFNSCANLTTADLTYFNTRSVTAASNFMTGCDNLTTVILGQYTEIFMRFDNLVSQVYWYTTDTVLDGEKLYLAAYPGTYYSTSPTVTLTVSVQGLEDYDDDVTVTVTMSDGGSVEVVCNSDNEWCGQVSICKYAGREEVYIVEAKAPEIEDYNTAEITIDGLDINVVYTPIYLTQIVFYYDSDVLCGRLYYGSPVVENQSLSFGIAVGSVLYDDSSSHTHSSASYYKTMKRFSLDETLSESDITSLNYLLYNASSVTTVDFSQMPETVTTLNYTLYWMTSLTELIMDMGLFTSQFTSYKYCFAYTTVPFDTISVTSVLDSGQVPAWNAMFYYATLPEDFTIDLSRSNRAVSLYCICSNATIKNLTLVSTGNISTILSDITCERLDMSGCQTITLYTSTISNLVVTSEILWPQSGTVQSLHMSRVTVPDDLDLTFLTSLKVSSAYIPFDRISAQRVILPEVDWNISLSTSTTGVFYNLQCDTLDVSRTTITLAEGANATRFIHISSLKTLYMSDTTNSMERTVDNFFFDCANLVGGNGTAFNDENVSSEFFRIDSSENPGYGTLKE